MNQQRLLRGDDETGVFDWRRAARELDVPVEISRALYARAQRQADDAQRAEALYLRWLRDAATLRQAEPPPVPGRQTRVMHEAAGRGRSSRELAALGPGKWTRSLLEDEREAEAAGAAAAAERAARPGARDLPAYDDVQRAVGTLGIPRQPDEPY